MGKGNSREKIVAIMLYLNVILVLVKGEEVGFRMNHAQSPKGALFHRERQRLGELSCSPVLPQLYPDLKEKSHRNENEQVNEVLDCRMNHAQSQNMF